MSVRLDKAVLELYPDFSRSRIEGLVKAGYVTVNGVVATKAGMKVSPDDALVVEIPPPVPAEPEPEDIPLDVVFEDEDMLVLNKAPGMVVHPAPGHFTGTLVNALLHHCPDLRGIGGVARPGIVHRLDMETSGLLVVAKSQQAMDGLVRAFASHASVEKTYLAVVHGRPRLDAGRIENMIGRHPVDRKRMAIVEKGGKLAITNWRVIRAAGSTPPISNLTISNSTISQSSNSAIPQSHNSPIPQSSNPAISQFPNSPISQSPNFTISQSHNSTIPQFHNQPISLMECRIETGRTHQIRVHMASLGCPVIGDAVYGKGALDRRLDPVPARQMLHAWRLTLWHPVRNERMTFEAPVPADMQPYMPLV